MKLAVLTSDLRKTRLLLAAVAAVLALGAHAGSAGAADWPVSGTGVCHLRTMGSMGTGSTSTITSPGSAWRNDGTHWVTMYKWTVVINATTKAQIPGAYHYVGGVNVAPGATVTFGADTVDIPARSPSNMFYVQVQDVIATYTYGTNILEAVDTGTFSSYWIYQGTNLQHDTYAKSYC